MCISQTRPQGVNGYPSPGRRLTATYAQSNSGTCTNHVEMSSCYAAAQSVNLWSSQGGLDADYTQSEPPGCYRKESTGMVRFNLYTASTVQHDGTNFKGVCCVSGCGDDDTSAPTKSPTASPTADSEDESDAWMLIFRQTVPTLLTEAEARRINPGDSDNDNYSILDTLEGFRESDGKFTLKLVWPERTGTNSQSWRQTTNPVFGTSGGVDGYEVRCRVTLPRADGRRRPSYEFHLFLLQALDAPFTLNSWGGLEYSTRVEAFLDGSVPDGGWWYVVGANALYQGGFPGGGSVESVVELYAMAEGLCHLCEETFYCPHVLTFVI